MGRSSPSAAACSPWRRLQQQLVSTQQSMEREYLKLRQAEARHRLLFQVASEAVLIVDAATRKILEANPAAGKLLGEGSKRLVGRLFPEGFDEPSTQALQGLMGAVRATGRTDDVTVRSADGAREFVTSASLFREERASFFLIRLARDLSTPAAAAPRAAASKVLEIVASAPEGFVVTDLRRPHPVRQPRLSRSGATGDRGAVAQRVAGALARPPRRGFQFAHRAIARARLAAAVRHPAARRIWIEQRCGNLRRIGGRRRGALLRLHHSRCGTARDLRPPESAATSPDRSRS